MTLTYFTARSILVPWAFEWERLKFFVFLLLSNPVLLGMEMKSSQSLMNARAQGHLVTWPRSFELKNFDKKFGDHFFKKQQG